MELELRTVERRTPEGTWQVIQFSDLRAGDYFKLYDPETVEPRYEDGSQVYVATGNAIPAPPEGNYGIEAENAQY